MNTETAKMLIRFYNMQASTAFRAGNTSNQKVVLEALDRAGDVVTLKNHIREYVRNNDDKDLVSMRIPVYQLGREEVYPITK